MISVIVPCFNQANYLSECLLSVLNQTYCDWECIIINDGSTDTTEEVALKWCSLDARFKYVHKSNGGLSSARNLGLACSRGQYIQFLDSDDRINKHKFEYQLRYFNSTIDVVISDYFPFDDRTDSFNVRRYKRPFPDSSNLIKDIILNWENRLSIPCHCVLFKSSILEKLDGSFFDENLPNHEDWVFWVKIFYNCYGIYNLRLSLAEYRIRENSMCSDEDGMARGFVLACESIVVYFKNKDNVKVLKFCMEKMKMINGKTHWSACNLIRLFIPPILWILLKRFNDLLVRIKAQVYF